MTTLIDLLKEAEASSKEGYKHPLWLPIKSFEGGTDTIAYGHKLSVKEHTEGFIELPTGSTVIGGITEVQAHSLLLSDIAKSLVKAEREWNSFNKDKCFSDLKPLYIDLLTEIVFNVGGLSKGGKFQWPKLAKAIISDDIETVKKEIERSSGGKKLTRRNNLLKKFIDNYERYI